MKTEDFRPGTIGDLVNGTMIEDGNRKIIIGETDCVAFTDDRGQWQVATGVVFNAIEDSARLDTLLWRKRVNDVISRKWPEGTRDEFYSESTKLAVVETMDGDMYRVWPDGDTERYRR